MGAKRLKARGLARTLFAKAATLALIALLLPSGAPAALRGIWPAHQFGGIEEGFGSAAAKI